MVILFFNTCEDRCIVPAQWLPFEWKFYCMLLESVVRIIEKLLVFGQHMFDANEFESLPPGALISS